MTLTLWLLGCGLVVLIVLVVLTVRTDVMDGKVEVEKGKRITALARDVAKATKDIGLIALVSRHVAEDALKNNPVLQEKLISSLDKAGAVCEDCPMRSSSICEDCGRESLPPKEVS